MKPLSLDLQNARTFDSLHFDFAEGVTALVGPNGSGKSTLVSAVDVALFGAESRSLADWLSTDRPEQTMTISLTFEHAGEVYRARRSFIGKGRGTTKVDLERHVYSGANGPSDAPGGWDALTRESASATQEELERLIGLNRDTFRASAYLAQGQASVFCEATPGRRKEILASVLGLQVWDGYRDKARAELKAAEQSLAVVRSKIESAETELAERPTLALAFVQAQENEQAARTALQDSESQLAKARERLSALQQAAAVREAAERARDAAETSRATLVTSLGVLDEQIRAAEARLAERPELAIVVAGIANLIAEQERLAAAAQGYRERQRIEQEIRAARWQETTLGEAALALEHRAHAVEASAGAETCDRCGQTLHADAAKRAADSYRAEASQKRSESAEHGDRATVLTASLAELPTEAPDAGRTREVADEIQRSRDAQQQLAALAEVDARLSAAIAERDQMRAELPEREQGVVDARAQLAALGPHDPAEYESAKQSLSLAERAQSTATIDLSAIEKEIARLEERLARLDKIAADTQTARARRDEHQQDVELLGHLERACGPNGVPALILETSAIPQLEAEWNRLLGLLPTDSGDRFEVELHTQRERKTGDGAVDALDVIVYANGHARPYSTYSGGEQMRIALAQRRALSNLLAHRKGADCPLMILDEPNSLDDQGMAALARVLQDLAAAEDLTVLVVSHDPALRDAFEQTVEIEKTDGRSRIVGSMQDTVPMAEAIS